MSSNKYRSNHLSGSGIGPPGGGDLDECTKRESFVGRILGAMLSACIVGAASGAAAAGTAIEYFHPGFGHYFITAFPEEVTAMDAGAIPGWQRTGETFAVETTPGPGLQPVCRFFSGASFAPKSSHVYTPYAAECEHLKQGSVWQPEGIAFQLAIPDANGVCSEGQDYLYRLYNNSMGNAPNHRYTNRYEMVIAMRLLGWISEGHLYTDAFACAPPTARPSIATPEGNWFRLTTGDGFVEMVVLENGEIWLWYLASPAGFEGVMHGTLTSSGAGGGFAGVFAGELRNYDFSKDQPSTVAMTGNFHPTSTLGGTAVVDGKVVTFAKGYATDYDRPASAFIATGTWEIGRFYRFDRATINVAATGEITGRSNSGCVLTGTLRPRPSGKNVYDLSVTYGGAGCDLGSGTATGIGLIFANFVEGEPFLGVRILAEKNDRTAGFAWEGYKR
jgi:hypothetical protein